MAAFVKSISSRVKCKNQERLPMSKILCLRISEELQRERAKKAAITSEKRYPLDGNLSTFSCRKVPVRKRCANARVVWQSHYFSLRSEKPYRTSFTYNSPVWL